MAEDIRMDEWLRELEKLTPSVDDAGHTVAELVKLLKMSTKRVTEMVRQGVLTGTIAVGSRSISCDWDGRARVYRVYRISQRKEKSVGKPNSGKKTLKQKIAENKGVKK